MNARLCPNCSALIESESALFCYNCGQELPLPRAESIAVKAEPVLSVKSRKKNYWLFPFTLLVLFLVLGFGYFVQNRRSPQLKVVSPAPEFTSSPVEEFISTISALPVVPFNLREYSFASLLPAQILFYFQARQPAVILGRLLTPEQKSELAKKTGLTLVESLSFLKDDFAYARTEKGFVLLVRVKDPDFVGTKLSEFSQEKIQGRLFSDTLIISDRATLGEIAEVAAGKAPALAKVAEFIEGGQRLTGKAQALIFVRNAPALGEVLQRTLGLGIGDLPENFLSGSLFVVDSALGNTKLILVNGKH